MSGLSYASSCFLLRVRPGSALLLFATRPEATNRALLRRKTNTRSAVRSSVAGGSSLEQKLTATPKNAPGQIGTTDTRASGPANSHPAVAVPTNRYDYAFRDEQGELLRAVVSALRAARWRTVEARSGMSPAVVRVDTRAIEGTRRGPTRIERVRPRPPVQSLCPLDAWRTLRD